MAAATAELRVHEPLLRALGVRGALEARDIFHANTCLVRDFAGGPLPPWPLAACLAQLRAAPAHLGAADGSGLASGLFLPDEAGVLNPNPNPNPIPDPDPDPHPNPDPDPDPDPNPNPNPNPGVLCPAAELTFDDAPWMSATLRGRGTGGGAEAAGGRPQV